MTEQQIEGQMSIFDLGIWSGKMYPEPSVQTKGKISERFSKKQPKLQTKMPLFLDLRGDGGHHQDVLWEKGGLLLGGYTMRSFGECPSEERESHLSQILEDTPHPKYCLSAKACSGILRRAEKRGKKLPNLLERTLRRQSAFKSEPDVMGGVKESLSNTSEQEHCQPSTTNTHCLNPWDVQSKHIQPQEGKAEALYSGECRGGGGESYVMQNKVYGISAYDSNAMKSSNPSSGIYEADTTRTLDNNGENPACNQGGMIVLEGNGSRPSHKGDGYRESDTMYTLNTTEHHAVCVGNGQTAQTRITDKVGALNCMHDQQAVLVTNRGAKPLLSTQQAIGEYKIGGWHRQ